MKLVLRILAFSLCLVATYSAASFNTTLAANAPNPRPSAPMPTCSPSNPACSMALR
ncbi:MAG: hypothetical protein LAN37_00930 [Acidobacteriia bacterium]|nr:hypothetical protein [Terriglobia bacterium]